MRIHVQNFASAHNFPITPEIWAHACARAPDVSAGHVVSFGDSPAAYAATAGEVEALVAQSAAMRALLPLPASPRLALIYCTSAGLERLAPFDWLPPGVTLMNNRGTHAEKAGEYGIMAILMLASHMPALVRAQQAQAWQPLHGSALRGRRVCVIGLGALGGAIAEQARRFGMHVTGVRRTPRPHPGCDEVIATDGLDAALPSTEFLVLAAPLTGQTRHILDAGRIARLPPGAGVINVGRGGLIEQEALLDALDAGRLGGAVLDVFTPEPVPAGHRLWTTRNLVMTPHVSADDPRTYNPRSLDIFFDNLREWQAGRPLPNRFDVARGY